MSDVTHGILMGLLLGSLLAAGSWVIGREQIRDQAVNAGVAEFVVKKAPDRQTTFRWKTPPTEKGQQ